MDAGLSPSHNRITLTTNQQIVNHIYTVQVTNLKDTAGNEISPESNSLFYKLLNMGSTGYSELLVDNVNASATDTSTSVSPNKTLDGLVLGDPDPYSLWAAQNMPQWIQYDLGTTKSISLIAISFYLWNNGQIFQYSIQTSDDLLQWNEVVSNATSASQEWTLNEFTNLSARYVRIICLSNNQADWASIWETQILAPENTTSVEFTVFTAQLSGNNNVRLNWTTGTEQNCKQFNIARKEGNNKFVTIGTVQGNGTVAKPRIYTYTDSTVKGGHYSYRLEEVDYDGNINYSNIVEIEVNEPKDYMLEQNYPNPFNPTTNISFSVPAESQVTLKSMIFWGNEIATLVNERKSQGYYKAEFSAANLPSGIYFVRMQAGQSFVAVKKMILLK